ncbi:eIF-2-alpha kinase activator GCN1-like isoform X2 [Paramacrobiotus metropolitanus]|uniref:eIF-2-alpha kinase activator GCN1-like isoform X2 n=1 Tax=Paramacrobiotus metropolitanus TaxID=2943436 RepID=UPI0024465750|nr:eIF-2-alpha kinase activator GCN1-like isoform X2 [Paramacrobiotus metropolitanus]
MPRYIGDRKSVILLDDFANRILEKASPENYGHFVAIVSGIANCVAFSASTAYSRKLARQALRLSVALYSKISPKSEEGKTLMHVLAKLLFCILASGRRADERQIGRILDPIFKQGDAFFACVAELLAKEDASVYMIGLVNAMVLYTETRRSDYLADDSVFDLCERPLRYITTEQFKESILPALTKALLRNPESALPAVVKILRSLKIDLSPFCLEIGKHLTVQLHSKVDESRRLSAEACKCLAQKCQNSGHAVELLRHVFAVLNGSEGKITVANERIDLLTGIGNLSYQPEKDLSSQAEPITTLFLSFVGSEAQEAISLHALSAFRLWIRKFNSVPANLVSAVKNLQAQKATTIRSALLTCLSLFPDLSQSERQLSEIIPVLTKTVDAAVAKPSDIAMCLEALPALSCLLSIYQSGSFTDQKRQNIWNAITDAKKEILISDRFLNALSEATSTSYIQLVEKLLLLNYDKLKPETIRAYLYAYAYVLVRNHHEIRKQGLDSWKRIMQLHSDKQLSEELVRGVGTALSKLRLSQNPADGDGAEESHFAKHAVHILTSITELFVELKCTPAAKGRLILEMLLVTQEPGIRSLNPNLWIDLLRRFHDDNIFPDKLFADNIAQIFQLLLTEHGLPDEAVENAVKTLVGFPTSVTVEKILSGIRASLQNSEFAAVSVDDFMVFKTPAGVLYDKSVLETAAGSDGGKGNVKRESKAYSFKEQMAEMELRKELEAKRKAESGGKEAPLNAKQKEAMTKQLAKENTIRLTVQAVYAKVQRIFLILDSMIKGNPEYMRVFKSQLIDVVSPLLHIPLLAQSACNTWMLLSKCADDPLRRNGLSIALAITSLRVLEPVCPLPPQLTQENLTAAISRIVHGLFLLCSEEAENGAHNETSELNSQPRITVPDGCFAFPLLRIVLNEDHAKKLGLKEPVLLEAFKIISKVLEVSSSKADESITNNYSNDDMAGLEMNEDNPAFLPLSDILRTVAAAGESTTGLFDHDIGTAVQNFAKAVKKAVDSGEQLQPDIVQQLLHILLIPKPFFRIASLQALMVLGDHLEPFVKDSAVRQLTMRRLFVAAHDCEDPKVVEFARELFQDLRLTPNEQLVEDCLDDVTFGQEFVRNSSSAALGVLLSQFPDKAEYVLDQLIQRYNKNAEICKVKLDKFGRALLDSQPDQWPARRGIASALTAVAPYLNKQEMLERLMDFMLQNPCALKDEKAPVRSDMLELGVTVVELHGEQYVGLLLEKFEECLAKAPKTGEYDIVRQNAIVIMGSLAKHLDKTHPKIRPIVHQLVAALSTPSEEVQKAVGRCIAPLVHVIEDDIRSVIPNLLHVLYESESYAHRRGAAYGLAGVFQGLGIMSLKDFDIMLTIMNGLQEKKNAQRRESSLLAVAMLSLGLGRVFEPFVLQVVPYILQSIGDPNIHVRQAADEASKVVMSQLTGPGVKLILPALLKGLEEEAWRAKAASIEMLGDMAFCAPRQLSTSLPMVVPKLIEAFGDSHTKVQESAVNALKKIASVIKNPEVIGLVPGILIALQDPAKKTTSCLKTILQTQFIHVVDAASLALLMPVVRRAIYDRGSENRKLSAQIMASLYSLADQKDLLPYLDGILPGLKNCLLDPAPEVRLCAAKALAALVKGTGETGFDQLKEWLFMKLVSENNSVDRSGAAQGLAESLGVLGLHKLQEVLPQFLKYVLDERTPSHVRDGYLLVFVYLPVVFGQDFSPFISDVIPAILLGLADDTEYVRETALLCGQRIVNYFADSAIELLLPQLEEGMFDENWRIRYASVQLLGDLLYKIAGASGKHTTTGLEEDENFGTEQSHSLILQRLGETHRNRVLAGLYICRSDNALVVRQAALHVWKVIVTNTPKTLREILSELFEILLDALASDNEERRQVAAKTLGELVRKLGERILPEVIPILQAGLDSEADEHREGVCVGLMEIISSSNKETVIMYCDILEPTLSKALLDPSGGVRRAAADAFCMLDNVVGHKILDDILPVLFDKVTDPVEGDRALDGLQQIMQRRSRVVLPYLIPRLTTPPINTKTLALLTAVAGEALSKHLGKVLPSLLNSLENKMGTPEQEEELGYCRSVVLSVEDETGVATLVESLMHGAQNEKTRMAAVTLLDVFFANTKVDVRAFFGTSIRPLMRLYMFDDPILVKKVASVIGTLIKKTPTDVIYENVSSLRTAIRAVHMELRVPSIPGLCLPEGAAVFIPLLRDALLSASADEKEVVGQTIGDLVRLSSQNGLKSSVVTITGPIIRILGDRYSSSVRTVLLDSLNALIEKCSLLIKPFVPQIQTTVSRALSDPIRSVRVKAGIVASNIAPMHPRLDTLANDLLEVARNNADLGTKETTLRSLRMILANAGSKLSPQYRSDVVAVVTRYLDADDNDLKNAASGVLGALCRFAVDDELASLLKNNIFDVSSSEWTLQHGHCLALGAALREAGEKLLSPQYADTTMDIILKHQTSDRVPIAITSMRCMGLYLLHQRKNNQPLNKKLLITLAKSLNHPAIEVKQLVAHICSHLALVCEQPLDISELKILVPQLVNGTKEKNTAVRYDSEMALADVLALRKDETLFENVKAAMDVGARDSLQNARKSLSKSVMQSATKLEELDETF